MKLLSAEETLERMEGELERVRDEAKTKYRTTDLDKLKDTSGHDKQQAEDRKALAFQMETFMAAIDHLYALSRMGVVINRSTPLIRP